MKFSEEYKSAMNEISPDEQTAHRIEQAVLERISSPEKAAPAKKKKPFYVYAGAFSGAAACIALACFVLVKVNTGNLQNNAGGMTIAPSGSFSNKAEESMADNALADTTNEIADIESTAPMNSGGYDFNEYKSSATFEGIEAPTMPSAADSENRSSEPKENAVQEYTITFLPDGGVVLEGNGINAEYRPDGSITHYAKPLQDLSRAKTENGELYQVRLEGNYLYIFEDDLQTVECYRLV